MHDFQLPDALIRKMIKRRGHAYAFEAIESGKTALIVIDMQNFFVAPPSGVPVAAEIVPIINRLAAALRRAGGLVAWVSSIFETEDREGWCVFFQNILGEARAQEHMTGLSENADSHRLFPGLDTKEVDLFVRKNRFSAFLPQACDLPGKLAERGVDTVLIAGTLTNVCCESSARDAMMLGYRTIMVADANAARNDAEQMAALTTFHRSFGDVRQSDEVIRLLGV